MAVAELKSSIHLLIDKIEDEELLTACLEVIENGLDKKSNNQVIGCTTQGKPLTRQSLINEIEAASQRVKSGKYISQEELEKTVSNW